MHAGIGEEEVDTTTWRRGNQLAQSEGTGKGGEGDCGYGLEVIRVKRESERASN